MLLRHFEVLIFPSEEAVEIFSLRVSLFSHEEREYFNTKRETVLSVGMKTERKEQKCKNRTNLFIQSYSCVMILRRITLLWSERDLVTTCSFSHGQYYVSLPHIDQSRVSQSTFLAESFHETVNAGGRRSAFCFRKAFDSVGEHYTSRVHVSSAASFHPVNAYVGLSIRSARSTSAKISFTRLLKSLIFGTWDKEKKYAEAI